MDRCGVSGGGEATGERRNADRVASGDEAGACAEDWTRRAHRRRGRSVRRRFTKVEHPFLYVKRHFGYAKVRYRGCTRTRSDWLCLFGLANLLKAERFLAAA